MCSINGMEMPLWDQKDSEEISAALISFLINDVLFKEFIILYFENEQSITLNFIKIHYVYGRNSWWFTSDILV